ncbi:MAG: sulfatase-like hydrolase/transferase, partial [Verrucomicrobiota bacterium]|nr:sulfatase-like hydrolase/transferase [Verrucomicrobiota bacterium]
MPQIPPNVLWICTDQQRYDTIRALGNRHINTPCIDQLAANGVTFTHAFAQSPVCTPSRAAFMTGRYPRTTKCRQNGQALPPNEKLVSRVFSVARDTSCMAGKQHQATSAT